MAQTDGSRIGSQGEVGCGPTTGLDPYSIPENSSLCFFLVPWHRTLSLKRQIPPGF